MYCTTYYSLKENNFTQLLAVSHNAIWVRFCLRICKCLSCVVWDMGTSDRFRFVYAGEAGYNGDQRSSTSDPFV